MKKRRIIAVLCTLLVIVYICLLEFLTIMVANPTTLQSIIALSIYSYISCFAGTDLFRAIDIKSRYNSCTKRKYMLNYYIFSFIQEICLVSSVAIGLILIFEIFYLKEQYIQILVFIIIGILGIIGVFKAHKQTVKNWDLYMETKIKQ